MKKSLIFVICFFVCCLVSCQNHKTLKIYDFEMDTLPYEKAIAASYFEEQHPFPAMIWGELRNERKIGDTLYRIIVDYGSPDSVYAYNYESQLTRTIPLDKVCKVGFESIYYHNHDSIFLFYRQQFVQKNPDLMLKFMSEVADFVLINGEGEPIGYYKMDNLPYMYSGEGSRKGSLIPINKDILGNHLWGDELLLNFFPGTHYYEENYKLFDPPLVALYNLKTKTYRMLNIRFPQKYIGKYFEDGGEFYWLLTEQGDKKDIIIMFSFVPDIYRYDFEKDTMFLLNCTYDKVLKTTDSASRKYEDMALQYHKPVWCETEKCYFRDVIFKHYKDYKPYTIIAQILDSNFNHLAYAIGDNVRKTPNIIPCSVAESAILNYSKDKLPHCIHFKRKLKRLRLIDFENQFMLKRPSKPKNSINSTTEYFTAMNIPKEPSLVVIINMKYVSGSCYEYLFQEMKTHQEEYETNNIYYICYNPDGTELIDLWLDRYDLKEAKNIRKDTTLLDNFEYMEDVSMGSFQYVLVNYLMNEKGNNGFMFPKYENLQFMYQIAIQEQLKKKEKNKKE